MLQHWPQIIMASLYAMGLLDAAHTHGEAKRGYHSFWVSALGFAIGIFLLYMGGFWN